MRETCRPDGSKTLVDTNSLFLYYNPLRNLGEIPTSLTIVGNTALESSRFIENPPSVLRRGVHL